MGIDFDFGAVLGQWPLLLRGVLWTLGLTAIATVIGMVVGVACAWSRASGPTWLRWVVGSYVELIRNTPFIVQLFFIFFGLPAAGFKLSPEVASVIAMVSQIIIVMLGSAVCSQISTEELSYAANLIQSRNFRAFEAFIIATVIYLALSVGARRLLNWAGPKYFFGR